ncbi:hypothetical protein ACJ2A9_06020 [Anaerobacillus sp. MEB173]|uniref:hypothetical protein n=1 Tax=Anaerobacillus sp. MEB173 TaxID=3383345 RepID=UPI003F93D79C
MNWLRLIFAVISISIFLYLIIQTSRFGKELKKATNDDRSISKRFVSKWDRKFSREVILIIIGSIFGILSIFLSHSGENQMDDKIMEMPFPELYSNLAVAPLYIIQLILCIGYLIFTRNEKGCILLIGKIYSLFIVVNYIIALYFRIFH